MSQIEPSTKLSNLNEAISYLKEGGGYDVTVAALFLSKGIPVPPSVIKRFRLGVGRLIDGGFDSISGKLTRSDARSNFEAQLQQDVVKAMAQAGTSELAGRSTNIPSTVALSMLSEYGLKFENKTAIAQQAFEALTQGPSIEDEAPNGDLDPDWLNYFSEIASQKSGHEMQRLMGQILAGEIRKPGSFSPMTISVLSTLTTSVAQKFELLCSVSLVMNNMVFVPTDIYPNFLSEGIPEIGFTYVDLLTLRAHSVLANETGSSWTINSGQIAEIASCEDKFWLWVNNQNGAQKISSALFTQVGNELHRLVCPKVEPTLHEKLSKFYSQPNWNFKKLPK